MKVESYLDEVWKDIEGYEGLYQVSNFGRVKSLNRYKRNPIHGFIKIKEKILKQHEAKVGYLHVKLHKNTEKKQFLVHRLVAEAFIPNPNNLSEVNHKDEDKTNNVVFNLEWCNRKYNVNYGTAASKRFEKLTNRKDLSKTVLQYTKDGQFVAEYPSAHDAEKKTGIGYQNICTCCKGGYFSNKRNKWVNRIQTGGYIWRYA